MADTRTKFGRTALWWAAEKGHVEIAVILLERGADVNMVTEVSLVHNEISFAAVDCNFTAETDAVVDIARNLIC